MNRCPALGALVVFSAVALSAQGPGGGRPSAFPPSTVAAPGPPILKRQLSNGLRVWIVEYHDVPIVQLSLVVLQGTGDDPPGRYGIASLTSAMLLLHLHRGRSSRQRRGGSACGPTVPPA